MLMETENIPDQSEKWIIIQKFIQKTYSSSNIYSKISWNAFSNQNFLLNSLQILQTTLKKDKLQLKLKS